MRVKPYNPVKSVNGVKRMNIESEPLIQTMRKDIAFLHSEIKRLEGEIEYSEKEEKSDSKVIYGLMIALFVLVIIL
jgi:hypothetical protein